MAGENPQTTMPPVPREPLIDPRTGRMSSQWERWMQQIQRVLSFTGGIAWAIINKAASKLSDIETRTHAMLQSVLGTGDRHITASENAEITALDALDAGMVAKTGNAAYSPRSIQGTANEVGVSFGDGGSGNPTVFLPDVIEGPRSFGTSTDNTTFEADGSQKMNGAATVWKDDNFAAVSLGVGASPPDLIALNGGTIYVRAFDGTAVTEQMFFATEYNHDGKEGADIYFHVHWSPTTAAAGDVKWQLTYQWVNTDGSFAGAETTISVTQAAGGVAWKANKISFPAISGTGKTIGSQIAGRLFRNPADAADTYAADAAITGTFGLHYEIDSIGSRQITAK